MGHDKPTGGAYRLWACAGMVLVAAAGVWRVSGSAGESPPRRPRVAEIRFGVIEPPVVAQRDITVRFATSNQQLEQQPLECSGMAWIAGRLVISSDRHRHAVFACPVDLERMEIGRPVPHVVIRNEQSLLDDAECAAVRPGPGGRPIVYVMCSLSNDRSELPLPMRRHLLRFTVDGTVPLTAAGATVIDAGAIRNALNGHFKAVGVKPYRTYYGEFSGREKNTYRWGNVEGITPAPDGSTWVCGMRNPLIEGLAILFAVRGVDDALDRKDPKRLALTDVFTLDLGGRGVSDLCWDPRTRGYLIAAARSNGPRLDRDKPFPPNTLDGALFWWSGRKREPPILFARVPDMKVEAICRLGTGLFIAVGSEEGDVSEGRPERQSVLTVMEFTGVAPGGQAAR